MALLNRRTSRRRFLEGNSLLPVLSGLLPSSVLGLAKSRAALGPEDSAAPNIYERLGVRTHINAKGTYTYLTGSLLPPEVAQAMEEAAQHYVVLEELQRAAGERIAKLLSVDAACVTSGAAGAMTLGVAACITGSDPEKIKRLPDTTGMKNEVIIQKKHR